MSRIPIKLAFFMVGSCEVLDHKACNTCFLSLTNRREQYLTSMYEDLTYNQGSVAKIDKPEEEPVVHGPGEGRHRVQAVVRVLALVHPFRANLEYHDHCQEVVDDDMMTHLDLGSDEVSIEKLPVLDPVKLADLLSRFRVVHLTTLLATLLLERHLWRVVDLYPEIKTSSLEREVKMRSTFPEKINKSPPR